MGTNFYWKNREGDGNLDDPEVHIGKRSAAGSYCWDCNVTLCVDGEAHLHQGDNEWYDSCPRCSKKPVPEGLGESPGGLELGFATPRTERPRGVRGCCSFTWAQEPDLVRERWGERVVDEYGREQSVAEFLAMLEANCPIRYYEIGARFS